MNEQDFYTAVGRARFSDRYYALCRRHPVRDLPPCRCRKDDVKQVLLELGREARWDGRDKSYSFDRPFDSAILHLGFVLQQRTTVEFWLWLEAGAERIGSRFAVIAREAASRAGETLPDPPYPRPQFHGTSELGLILAECFDLADATLTTLQRAVRGGDP